MNGNQKRRSFWIAVVLLFLFLCILILVPPSHSKQSDVKVAFVGFTNSAQSTEALFTLSNLPDAALSLESVRSLAPPGISDATSEKGYFHWTKREAGAMLYGIGVTTTNEPLQIVFRFQLRASGPRRAVEHLRELLGQALGNEKDFFTGSSFFVTNAILGPPSSK